MSVNRKASCITFALHFISLEEPTQGRFFYLRCWFVHSTWTGLCASAGRTSTSALISFPPHPSLEGLESSHFSSPYKNETKLFWMWLRLGRTEPCCAEVPGWIGGAYFNAMMGDPGLQNLPPYCPHWVPHGYVHCRLQTPLSPRLGSGRTSLTAKHPLYRHLVRPMSKWDQWQSLLQTAGFTVTSQLFPTSCLVLILSHWSDESPFLETNLFGWAILGPVRWKMGDSATGWFRMSGHMRNCRASGGTKRRMNVTLILVRAAQPSTRIIARMCVLALILDPTTARSCSTEKTDVLDFALHFGAKQNR